MSLGFACWLWGEAEAAADSILVATSKVGSFGKETPFRRRKSVLWPLHLHQKDLLGWLVESDCSALGSVGLKEALIVVALEAPSSLHGPGQQANF